MALAAYTDIESWIGRTLDSGRQAEATSCIGFAQSWIANQAGLRSLEKESAAVTLYEDGEKLTSASEFWLSAACRPAWHVGTSDIFTVSENGAALTVAVGYSSTASVILSGVNSMDRVRLYRAGGWSWSRGLPGNISVACKCGFDTSSTASTNPLPLDVKRLVVEVAWLMLNGSQRTGKTSVSKAGTSVSISEDLSSAATGTLDWLRGI
jgi:hypothetical protein